MMGVKLNILHSLALTLTTSVALVRAVESKCPDDLLHHGDLVVAKGASIEILGPIKVGFVEYCRLCEMSCHRR